jgi:hypothetical protein
MTDLHGVICYWQFESSKTVDRENAKWKLIESYPISLHGYPLIRPINTGDPRHEWREWVFDKDGFPIYGRAVTAWSFDYGVTLMQITPLKKDEPTWFTRDYNEKLTKLKDWASWIVDGHTLSSGTAAEVRKLLSEGGKK